MFESLEEILDDPKLSSSFIEFAHKTHSQDTIEFWIEVERYKRIIIGEECVKVARRLYNMYIRKGAEFELTLTHQIKEDIRTKLEEGM